MKMALSKFKRRGGKFISINPVRTGYSAIADEWVPIKPGTDGALLLAINHELIKQGLYDRDFLVQYTNAAELVVDDPSRDDHGLFYRVEMHYEEGCFDPQNRLWWDRDLDVPIGTHTPGADPRMLGEYTMDDGTTGQAGLPVAQGPCRAVHARVGGGHHGYSRRHHPPPGVRDGRHGARPAHRAAHPVDRLLGQRPRIGDRQSGGLPCHARPRGAFQRLPDASAPSASS